jgi:uncharacterized protein YukE
MAQNISVNFERLSSMAAQLRTTRDDADRVISSIRTDVRTLTTGGFKTVNASGRFGDIANRWADHTNQAMLALDEISRAVDNTASRHQQTDSSMAEGVNTIAPTGNA